MNTTPRIVRVVCKLTRIPMAEVITTVDSILLKMTANPKFPDPEPSLPVIRRQRLQLINIVAKAKDGATADKAAVKVKLRRLLLSMTTLKAYVQTIANADAATAEQVVESSGLTVQRFTPRQKRTFGVTNTTARGTVKAVCPRTKKDVMFLFSYTTTPENEASYVKTEPSPAATAIISGLKSRERYYFRWATITAKGQTAWSQVMDTVVQ